MDYKSKRWRRKRREILRRDKERCRECRRYGIGATATVAHHVFPAEDYPELIWESWNLIGLCESCHGAMHDRITGKLTPAGRGWQRRVSPPPSGPL